MKKILLFGRSAAITKLEQDLKVQMPIYEQANAILESTGLKLGDEALFDKLMDHYTKGITIDITPAKKLGLTEKEGEYHQLKKLVDALTYPLEVYTEAGKKKFISSNYIEYADTEELEAEYKALKNIIDAMEAMQISRSKIKDALNEWAVTWNPYSPDDLEIPKRHLLDGIETRKQKAASESMQVQLKRF